MLPMAPAPRAALPLAIGAELISAISRWLADPDPDHGTNLRRAFFASDAGDCGQDGAGQEKYIPARRSKFLRLPAQVEPADGRRYLAVNDEA